MAVDDYFQILLHLRNPRPKVHHAALCIGWQLSWNIVDWMSRGSYQFEIDPGTPCEDCGKTPTRLYPAHTSYEFEKGNPLEPNVERPFCEKCGEEWNEYWEDMWAEYYRDKL